jgi:hypothetical protein
MHLYETQVLNELQQYFFIPKIDEDKLLSLPLGNFSEEFRHSPLLEKYCNTKTCYALKFRLALENYLKSGKKEELNSIEDLLLNLPSPIGVTDHKVVQKRNAGTYLLPVSVDLVRQVYLSDDLALIELFKKHFPIPPSVIFNLAPELITAREQSALKTIKEMNLKTEESAVIKLQRKIRMQNRQREELVRIAMLEEESQTNFLFLRSMESEAVSKFHQELLSEVLQNQNVDSYVPTCKPESRESIFKRYQENIQLKATATTKDANTPYTPKCEPKLAERIMMCARSISAFSTIKHITSEKSLVSILDDALYGRRNLMDLYLPFNPASQKLCDLLNGDGNVVCLGTQYIDPLANGDIIITFDLSKTIATDPAAFYKQRDLEYDFAKNRYVKLGGETICFDHTLKVNVRDPRMTYFMLWDKAGRERVSGLDKNIFIINNLEQIHEILTLNFFRFIDAFNDIEFSEQFYEKIDKLTDEELFIFLTDIEKNFTDSAEFNFYGAHKIDFSCITGIEKKDINYKLNLSEFIESLNQGNINELRISRLKISKLFQSYRFLDYLLSKVSHPEVLYYLWDLRKQCITPGWEQCPEMPPEKFEIDWSLKPDDTPVIISENVELQIPSPSVESEREPDFIPENNLTDTNSLCNDFMDVNVHDSDFSESNKGTELFSTKNTIINPDIQQPLKSTDNADLFEKSSLLINQKAPISKEERVDIPENQLSSEMLIGIKTAAQVDLSDDLDSMSKLPALSESTSGDFQIFLNPKDKSSEEMDPSFLFACCSKFNAVEVLGYVVLVALVAIAVTANGVAIAAVASAAAVPIVYGLSFFWSKPKNGDENPAPLDYLDYSRQ